MKQWNKCQTRSPQNMPESGVSVLRLWSHLLRCRAIFDQRFHQKQSFHDQKMVGRLDPFTELTNPFCTECRVFGWFCQFTSVEGMCPEFTPIQLEIVSEGQANSSRERFWIETGALFKHFLVLVNKDSVQFNNEFHTMNSDLFACGAGFGFRRSWGPGSDRAGLVLIWPAGLL